MRKWIRMRLMVQTQVKMGGQNQNQGQGQAQGQGKDQVRLGQVVTYPWRRTEGGGRREGDAKLVQLTDGRSAAPALEPAHKHAKPVLRARSASESGTRRVNQPTRKR
eukprot:6182355-Pleurochrysis_carterae.AAC.2